MKKKIKKVVLSCFLAVLCGTVCGKLVYGVYDKKIEKDVLQGEKIYLVQAGAYSNYDSMVKNTSVSNYVYYQDEDGLFKQVVGLTLEKENIEKIKTSYGGEILITEYYSKDNELNHKIKEYDKKIEQAETKEEVQKLVLEILNLYKDKKTTLIQIAS